MESPLFRTPSPDLGRWFRHLGKLSPSLAIISPASATDSPGLGTPAPSVGNVSPCLGIGSPGLGKRAVVGAAFSPRRLAWFRDSAGGCLDHGTLSPRLGICWRGVGIDSPGLGKCSPGVGKPFSERKSCLGRESSRWRGSGKSRADRATSLGHASAVGRRVGTWRWWNRGRMR